MFTLSQPSSFIGRFYLPNINSPEVAAQINLAITEWQPIFLRELLGVKWAVDFQAWLDIIGVRPPDVLFDGLLTGATFVDLWGCTQWSEKLETSFTAYVYDKLQRANSTQTAAMGEVVINSQNASNASAIQKLVDNNNLRVVYNRDNWNFINLQLIADSDWMTFIYSQWGWRYCDWNWFPYGFTCTDRNIQELYTLINSFGI